MKKKILVSLSLFFITTLKLSAQSCFNVSAGNDTTISCLQDTINLKARIPDIRSTENYQVISIPYTPYLYTTPGGTTDPFVDADDNFSDSFLLPFPFCFYGNTYNKLCVGSNGVLTFDVFTNAAREESYVINSSNTLPYSGNSPNDANVFYAPRASIFLAYYDMNPLTSPAGNKIEWRVEGTAPCRRFVVAYYQIGNYETGFCPNATNLCTMQAVLYEGSGIIDVFYKNKPACVASTNGNGISIAGVQNWGQDQAVTPPGKNCTVWTAVNEGFRYVPSGTTSLLNRVELYKNGTLISTGTTSSLGNGELEALFADIYQPEDSMSYVVRAFYQQCDNPAIETEGSDTIIVYKTLNPLDITGSDALCNGGNGTITVNSPTAANIEYSIDGGTTWQTSPVFSAPAGSYTVLARVIGSMCGGTSNTVNIAEPTALSVSPAVMDATCANNSGSITLTPAGGTPAYQYSIDNGVTYQASNQFLNLAPGNYNNLIVKDANGCLLPSPQTVLLIDTMYLDLGADSTICFGSIITIIPITNALTDTFKWTPAATLDFDTVRTPVASPTDTIKYFLTAKWGACQRTDSITINVLHKPVAYAGRDTTICANTSATLKGTATNLSGTVNYAWAPVATLSSPNTAITSARPDSSQQYFLTVTDNYSCNFSVSDSVWVNIMPPINAFAGNDTNAVINRPHQLMATGGGVGASFLWSPSASLNNSFIANPLATLMHDTYFTVLVTDSIGCSESDYVFVKVYEGPNYYLPNAFTPNGDGLNDIFRPIPVGIRSTDYFRIFDRYGKLMFETREWMQGWDGTIKGKPAASGTFVWMIKGIDKNGAVVEMKGTVILIR